MILRRTSFLIALLAAAPLSAQQPPAPAPQPPAQQPPAQQPPAPQPPVPLMSEAAQIASAVAPLPEQFRATATVLGYRAQGGPLVPLRATDGPYICLATVPGSERFHVACYHRSLEPLMARGRELRAQGHNDEKMNELRNAEAKAGTLKLPEQPAALYSVTGNVTHVDTATGAVAGARALYVVYMPYATAESTGIPTTPTTNAPWLMFAGTPRAHIMFVPRM